MLTGVIAIAAGIWLLAGKRFAALAGPALRRAEPVADRVADAMIARLGGPDGQPDPVGVCAALAAELRAGTAPDAALVAVSGEGPMLRRARTAALLGEPVGPALAADADAAGPVAGHALRGMAACWSVAADSGAGLADGLDRVAALATARQRIGADLDAEIAAPRATARILSLLPLLGLALGELLGARPVAWLLGSPIGLVCLGVGVGLVLLGRVWTARIVASVLPEHTGKH